MKVKTYFKEKPERNEKYLKFIRSKRCLKCCASINISAHHEQKKGHGGIATKCSDKRTLPLCADCHVLLPKSRHRTSREEFWGKFLGEKIDIEAKIKEFNAEWENV
jgi:hypothetical protein